MATSTDQRNFPTLLPNFLPGRFHSRVAIPSLFSSRALEPFTCNRIVFSTLRDLFNFSVETCLGWLQTVKRIRGLKRMMVPRYWTPQAEEKKKKRGGGGGIALPSLPKSSPVKKGNGLCYSFVRWWNITPPASARRRNITMLDGYSTSLSQDPILPQSDSLWC